MLLYALTLVPLAEEMREAHPNILQPWYADDASMAGKVSRIAALMRILLARGPARGYYPEPAKSVFLCRPQDRARSHRTPSSLPGQQ